MAVRSALPRRVNCGGAASELSSTLKLLERMHGLPTLALQNHRFDVGTPIGPNFEAAGGTAGSMTKHSPAAFSREDIEDSRRGRSALCP
jgi:hypothetical protein